MLLFHYVLYTLEQSFSQPFWKALGIKMGFCFGKLLASSLSYGPGFLAYPSRSVLMQISRQLLLANGGFGEVSDYEPYFLFCRT